MADFFYYIIKKYGGCAFLYHNILDVLFSFDTIYAVNFCNNFDKNKKFKYILKKKRTVKKLFTVLLIYYAAYFNALNSLSKTTLTLSPSEILPSSISPASISSIFD